MQVVHFFIDSKYASLEISIMYCWNSESVTLASNSWQSWGHLHNFVKSSIFTPRKSGWEPSRLYMYNFHIFHAFFFVWAIARFCSNPHDLYICRKHYCSLNCWAKHCLWLSAMDGDGGPGSADFNEGVAAMRG
jgi:hypothetical protein